MFRRYLKFGLLAGASVGTAVSLHNNDYQLDSIGAVRLARSALAAYSIARTYKTELYARNLDKTSDEYKDLKSRAHKMAAEKLLELCKTNKGVYIKVGQHIGALDYLLPSEYVHTMRILHKDAPSNTVDMIYKVIREDLKCEPSELFEEFDPTPLGTASLAQVHRARLKDGTVVAVKVQHHFVRGNVRVDLRTMETLIKVMSWLFPDFQMQWLVDETRRNIVRELDFQQEGRNAERLASMFHSYSWLHVPAVHWGLTSQRVLTMEYVDGGQVNDYRYIKEHNIDPYDLSRKLGDLYAHMIFVNGFVHSDPHPGNILVRKDPEDKKVTVYLLDHGLYAHLTDKFRYDYSQFWLSIIKRDRKAMRQYAQNLGIRGELYGLFACMVTGRPWDTIVRGIDRTKPDESEKSQFQSELPKLINDISSCLETMDRQTLLVLKTNDLIRSIEVALGTHQRMCGFTVMARCCLMSVNSERYRRATSLLQRLAIRVERYSTLLWYYIYQIMTELRFRFLL